MKTYNTHVPKTYSKGGNREERRKGNKEEKKEEEREIKREKSTYIPVQYAIINDIHACIHWTITTFCLYNMNTYTFTHDEAS